LCLYHQHGLLLPWKIGKLQCFKVVHNDNEIIYVESGILTHELLRDKNTTFYAVN